MNLGLMDPAFVGSLITSAYDIDAQTYITAVETADGQALETAVKDAINAFVVGCKADGIWTAIKASCILAGARTLAGALVPLVGTAPTIYGTLGNWNYNRKTGLQGDGTSNYLLTGLAYNSISSNNEHVSIRISSTASANMIGGGITSPFCISRIVSISSNNTYGFDSQGGVYGAIGNFAFPNFIGMSRASSTQFTTRESGTSTLRTANSATRANVNSVFGVFCANYSDIGVPAGFISNTRIAFFSIGSSLNLAALDTRVTTLINAIAAAIP